MLCYPQSKRRTPPNIACDTEAMTDQDQSPSIARRMSQVVTAGLLLFIGCLLLPGGPPLRRHGQDQNKKQRTAPRAGSENSVTAHGPMPYKPRDGAFHFIATVQLPKEVDEQLMLEVSALVTSSSMTSLRFLSIRSR